LPSGSNLLLSRYPVRRFSHRTRPFFFNTTRNNFAEVGHRYAYVDYTNGGFLYQVNAFGRFSGIGVTF